MPALVAGLALALTACTEPEPTVEPPPEFEQADEQVRMVDVSFEPDQLDVPVGTEVAWLNDDVAPHTVTFDDEVDSGELDTGESFTPTSRASTTTPAGSTRR